ncbi:hypothetical protein ACUXIZ_005087 [Cytobacillus horneckiae]
MLWKNKVDAPFIMYEGIRRKDLANAKFFVAYLRTGTG